MLGLVGDQVLLRVYCLAQWTQKTDFQRWTKIPNFEIEHLNGTIPRSYGAFHGVLLEFVALKILLHVLPFDSRLFFYIKGKTSSPGSQPPSKRTKVGSFLDDDKPPYHHLQKKWWNSSIPMVATFPWTYQGNLTGKTVKSSRHPPPGQWKVLELEFYTSEFCVQDPEAVESKIYGLPLAMQGVACVFGVFFVTRYLCWVQNRYI